MTSVIDASTYLGDIRVLEVADERGEYCGKVLAGLGADVVKVEPPSGESTRGYGPFYQDMPHPDRSLHFWHYNHGKRSVVLDLDDSGDQDRFRALAEVADVIIDTRPRGFMDARGIGRTALSQNNPGLVYARISPFGDSGPWAHFQASDLVHLALGGVMMNCGYDPDPLGRYDTPPIAPQMWQAYHIAGEMSVISILGALVHRLRSGAGQSLSTSIHQAVSTNTETDSPDWVYLGQPHHRLTCRHSMPAATVPALSMTKDGRYLVPYRTYLRSTMSTWEGSVAVLEQFGLAGELSDSKYDDLDARFTPEATAMMTSRIERLVGQTLFSADLWKLGQQQGLPWAPVRRPEENIGEPHWDARDAFSRVHHPELGRTFTYTGAKWSASDAPWRQGPRPPLLGEHTAQVLRQWTAQGSSRPARPAAADPAPAALSPHGTPFALAGVRVLDLSWMLASAGAGRFLAAMGAEVIKVEHSSRWDGMRWGAGSAPRGGRDERERATAPIEAPVTDDPNRSGAFMEINAGKLGISLNLKSAEGRAVLEDLIRESDILVEGFSPGTLDRMGFGRDRLKELNPRIIYVQQTGFGQTGTYGAFRAFGPTAAALTGISEMSGLPEPFPPAGIGYSYLDWFGAYNMANAMLAALYRRQVTGEGIHIDASQGDTGLYLVGTTILDHSANGRRWSRYGNRSPYKPAAPHGAYPTLGDDRWIAIAAFTEEHWEGVREVLGGQNWARDPRFADLASRRKNEDALDAAVGEATRGWDGRELMEALQSHGVPAGVCQTAQDRYERDPQLDHLGWVTELRQTEIGTWPVKEHAVRMSLTPTYIGGPPDRSGPNYGEDTDRVLREVLGYDATRIASLRDAGAL